MAQSKSTATVAQQAAVVAERPGDTEEIIARWFAGISLETRISLVLADAVQTSGHPLEEWWHDRLAEIEDELLSQAADGALEGVNAAMAGIALAEEAWSRSF